MTRAKNEIWKEIKGYDGRYQVSNYGRIQSFARRNPRILSNHVAKNGYELACLCKEGKGRLVLVHRLVAIAFIEGNILLTVNHKDGNKNNNYFENLEWMSQKDNFQHFLSNNVCKLRGENCYRSKVTEKEVLAIRELYAKGNCGCKKIAKVFNTSRDVVRCIVKRKSWAWLK